jgi:hypothetical protein
MVNEARRVVVWYVKINVIHVEVVDMSQDLNCFPRSCSTMIMRISGLNYAINALIVVQKINCSSYN